jgi:putative membrane protein
MRRYEMPVFTINGFLDSGKTTFIKNVLEQNQFSEFRKKLLILCEGEEEYSEAFLKKHGISLVTLEQEEFTQEKLASLEKTYKPWAVIIEYNPMWKAIRVDEDALPKGWEIYQQITVVDASTFELYRNNMKSIVSETLKDADMVLFNRCNADMNLASYRRSAKALSNGVQIILENEDGSIMPLAEQLPYDINAKRITVEDEDFGIWYLDMMERSDLYVGKTVTVSGKVARLRRASEGFFAAGRMVMTCCADDTQFLGLVCHYAKADELQSEAWVKLKAKIDFEYRAEYRREGPVLEVIELSMVDAPKDEMIYL